MLSLSAHDDDDDVYYYIRWRLKLEGETENTGVCTKERKGVTAREMFAVASPIELYDRIKMLRGYITQQLQFRDDDDDDNNDRCPFQLLCMLLRDSFAPHLVLDPL